MNYLNYTYKPEEKLLIKIKRSNPNRHYYSNIAKKAARLLR